MPPRAPLIVCAVTALGSTLAAAAGARDPFDYSFWTYVWVLLLSAFGGLVNFSHKIQDGRTSPFRLTEFIGELVTSAFAGLLTFWLCESAGIDKLISAVLIAISGHMGSRAIFRFERWLERRLNGDLTP
jgi:predicted CDP-diglyceride synthetase/phosphatidate cytidylyltransferase